MSTFEKTIVIGDLKISTSEISKILTENFSQNGIKREIIILSKLGNGSFGHVYEILLSIYKEFLIYKNEVNSYVYLNKVFTAIELKKIKMEFIKISKNLPPKNKEETIKNFVEYIVTVQDRY